ncbi:Hypothetical protein SCF082_LOCUS13232, partial [Durusdinium trenchii]
VLVEARRDKEREAAAGEGKSQDQGKARRRRRRDKAEQVLEQFEPGSLDMEQTATLAQCFVNTKEHRRPGRYCTTAERYGLTFLMVPKSGSSSGRKMFDKFMGGKEKNMHACSLDIFHSPNNTIETVTAVREPLSRWWSQYGEVILRTLGKVHKIPEQYLSPKRAMLGNISYSKYVRLFKTEQGREFVRDMFEDFMELYDGKHVFDIHLNLQTIMLWDFTRRVPVPVKHMMHTENITKEIYELASRAGFGPLPKEALELHSYKGKRRFNTTLVKVPTVQKVCRLMALDYCCLNYELPPECRDPGIPKGQRVKCEWFIPANHNFKRIRPALV